MKGITGDHLHGGAVSGDRHEALFPYSAGVELGNRGTERKENGDLVPVAVGTRRCHQPEVACQTAIDF